MCQEKIDEAGAGDFHLANQGVGGQGGDQLLGQVTRLGACRLGQQHGSVGREVAVFAAARSLDHKIGHVDAVRQDGVVLKCLDGLKDEFAQCFFHGRGSILMEPRILTETVRRTAFPFRSVALADL